MNWKWNLVSYRKIWFTFSTLLVIPCIIAIAVFGFNWGIDFTGGTIIDLNFAKAMTLLSLES